MPKTHDQLLLLLKRIHVSWRWDRLYTAIYADGQERKVNNPNNVPTEGLIGVYNNMIGLKDLREDLNFGAA